MESTTENFLELIIEKEHVRVLKYIMDVISSKPFCKIVFDSTTCEENKCVIYFYPFNENKNYDFCINLDFIKLRHFKCKIPKLSIVTNLELLSERIHEININDPMILYIKDPNSQIFIYNLDENNNHY
uniref:Uncharacterized protein n=1 Tax=Borely moumouvirus TaxID=2712067 RepID=A0A6G6ABI7_9VIRU